MRRWRLIRNSSASLIAVVAISGCRTPPPLPRYENVEFGFHFSHPQTWAVVADDAVRREEIGVNPTEGTLEDREVVSFHTTRSGPVLGRFSVRADDSSPEAYLARYLRTFEGTLAAPFDIKRAEFQDLRGVGTDLRIRTKDGPVTQLVVVSATGSSSLMVIMSARDEPQLREMMSAYGSLDFARPNQP